MNETRRWALSFFLGVLVGGLLVGMGFHHFIICRTKKDVSWRDSRESRRKEFLGDLRKNLNLTPEQDQKVISILDSKRKQIETFRGTVRPQFKKIREETQAEIRAVLPPVQRVIFNKMVEERNKK